MALALGAFDPKTPADEAFRMICLADPELPARLREAEQEFVRTSILKYFINEPA